MPQFFYNGLDDVVVSSPMGDGDSTQGLDRILYLVSEGQLSQANAVELIKIYDPEVRYGNANLRVADAVFGCIGSGVPENEMMQVLSKGFADAGPALEELIAKYRQ